MIRAKKLLVEKNLAEAREALKNLSPNTENQDEDDEEDQDQNQGKKQTRESNTQGLKEADLDALEGMDMNQLLEYTRNMILSSKLPSKELGHVNNEEYPNSSLEDDEPQDPSDSGDDMNNSDPEGPDKKYSRLTIDTSNVPIVYLSYPLTLSGVEEFQLFITNQRAVKHGVDKNFPRSKFILNTANEQLRYYFLGNNIDIDDYDTLDDMSDEKFFEACRFCLSTSTMTGAAGTLQDYKNLISEAIIPFDAPLGVNSLLEYLNSQNDVLKSIKVKAYTLDEESEKRLVKTILDSKFKALPMVELKNTILRLNNNKNPETLKLFQDLLARAAGDFKIAVDRVLGSLNRDNQNMLKEALAYKKPKNFSKTITSISTSNNKNIDNNNNKINNNNNNNKNNVNNKKRKLDKTFSSQQSKNSNVQSSITSRCNGCGKLGVHTWNKCGFNKHPDFNKKEETPFASSSAGIAYFKKYPQRQELGLDWSLKTSEDHSADKKKGELNLISSDTSTPYIPSVILINNKKFNIKTVIDTMALQANYISQDLANTLKVAGVASCMCNNIVCDAFGYCRDIKSFINFDLILNNEINFET